MAVSLAGNRFFFHDKVCKMESIMSGAFFASVKYYYIIVKEDKTVSDNRIDEVDYVLWYVLTEY